MTVDAKLVIVPAVVRDKHGALVPGLTGESFVLQVDGKPQAVRYFDHDADAPLLVGLLIDTSMSQRSVLDDERAASSTFLEKMMAPERDSAFIIQFAHTVDLLQDVTTSRPKLAEALKQVEVARPTLQRGNDFAEPQQDRHGHYGQGAGTALYDSVFLASDEVVANKAGRRALILLTDGDDHGSLKTLPQAIEAAQRADTIVYAIYYTGEHDGGWGQGGHPGGGPGGGGRHGGGFPLMEGWQGGYGQVDGKKVLERLCAETGGRVFVVSKKETVEKIYSEIGEELRSQYRLGFTPTAGAAAAGYHQIDLTLAGPLAKAKDKVQARDGYYKR